MLHFVEYFYPKETVKERVKILKNHQNINMIFALLVKVVVKKGNFIKIYLNIRVLPDMGQALT
jgi:hypothetical protein